MMSMLPIVVITVKFLLSLAGAFVLFKWLDATAVIKKRTWQAGGSLAGFVLIFGMLHLAYMKCSYVHSLRAENLRLEAKVSELERLAGVELWEMVGQVLLEDGTDHRMVEIDILPPPPRTTSLSGGEFFLEFKAAEGRWPKLHLHTEGYYDQILEIDEADIDIDQREIKLEPVTLIPQSGAYVQAERLEDDAPVPRAEVILASLP